MCADAIKKLPGLHKTTDVTLKRGALAASETQENSLKNLPGKKKPPTLSAKPEKKV